MGDQKVFSRKSSTRTSVEGAGSKLVAVLAQKSTDGNLVATKGYRSRRPHAASLTTVAGQSEAD